MRKLAPVITDQARIAMILSLARLNAIVILGSM